MSDFWIGFLAGAGVMLVGGIILALMAWWAIVRLFWWD